MRDKDERCSKNVTEGERCKTQKTAATAATHMPSYVQRRLGFWEGTEMCGVVNELEEGEGGCARVGRKRGEGKRKGNPHALLCTTLFGILGRG